MRDSARDLVSISLRVVLLGLLAIGGFTLAGCGDDDPCAGKVCEFGTCDSSSGQCVNVESCNIDVECIPGYLCEQNGTCVAQNTCEADSDCSAGLCEDGACVNPDQCEQNADCLSRTYCGDGGTCRPDPCNDVQCQRGVCQRGSDNCVSADSCTERTETVDCVAGERCAEGSCEPAETFCDNITCERGVCSFTEGGCTNAMNCEGSDQNCEEGFFCNDMDACQPNLCVQNNVDCGDDGVCMPSSGQCRSATTCTSSSDCSGSDLCVSESDPSDEGVCLPETNACGNATGDGGCPGNQSCNYDPDTLTAECAEPEVCETSVDCKDGRQCGGRSCLAQVSCKSDRFEPNNTMEEATSFTEVAEDLLVNGSLCQGDTDRFSFLTTDIVSPTTSGTIVVSVTVPDRDIGLGTMSATLTGPDGSQLGSDSMSLMAEDGSLQMTTSLGIPDHGTYSVALEPSGQMTSAGLNYEMTVNVVPQGAVQACQDAQVITSGQRLSGSTEGAPTSGIGASCLGDDESSSEVVYALELEESREVTITADPVAPEGNPVVSLRSRCLEAGSERACSNDNGEGGSESISAVLSAGTHYVVVQSPSGSTLGEFELTVDSPFSTACGPSDSYCVDGSTSAVCTRGGGRFAEISCDDQCNPSSGECFPPAGDRCGDAPEISNESMSQMREIDLRQYNDNYSLSQGGCIDGQPRTGGPDAAYAVTIPANTTVTAAVSYGAGAQGALYFVDDCSDVQGTCQKGQQGDDDTPSEEEIFFINDTESEVTKTLIVDTAAEQRLGETQVNFSYAEIVCTPDTGQCNMAGNNEICNPKGTGVGTVEMCALDCQSGSCTGDSCAAPFNLTQAASQSGGLTMNGVGWNNFTNQYQGNDTCGGGPNIDTVDTEGVEVVFQIDMAAGEAFTATIANIDPQQASLYLKSSMDCGTSNTACLDAIEEEGDDVTVTYSTQQAETIYMIADTEDDSGGTFDLSAELITACTVGSQSCVSGNVEYCPPSGFPQTFQCSGGCTNAFCNTRNSEFCYDAQNITAAANSSSNFTAALDLSTFSNDLEGDSCGGVSDFENDGPEAVYAIDLQAGDVLDATFDNRSSFDDPALMLLSDCGDLQTSCLAGDEDSNTANVQYLAQSAETVFLVADVDDPTVSDTFDLTVDVTPQQCNPATYTPTCDGSGDLQYCNDLGQFVTYTCQGGCSGGACGTPTGGICADAKPLSNGGSAGNSYVGTNNIDPVGDGNTGSCSFGENTAGADWVYEVSLQANETLTANYNGNSCCDIMYVLTTCSDTSTCVGAADNDGQVTYTAGNSAETVYVVMDHDSYTNNSFWNYTLNITIN